ATGRDSGSARQRVLAAVTTCGASALVLDLEADAPRRRLRRPRGLPAQELDPPLRQPALLGALDQVLEEPSAGGSFLAPLLRPRDVRLRCDALPLRLDEDVDLLGEAGRDAFLAQHCFLCRRRDLEQDAVDLAVLVLGQVGDPAAPEPTLDVEREAVPAQNCSDTARE